MPISPRRIQRPRNQQGFTLVLVLLVTVLLTVSIGAGFVLTGTEHEAASDHNAQLKAYAVAQEGLERYLTDVTSLPAVFPDARSISVPGGAAAVTLRRMMTGTNPIYVVTSVGQATSRGLRRSFRTPVGERTISQFLVWEPGNLDVAAAFTSLAGLSAKNGVAGTVSGIDVPDPVTGCSGAGTPIAGLDVPNAGLDMNGHNTNFIDGIPDNAPEYIGTPGPTGTAKDAVDVDWAKILAGSIAPDFVLDRSGGKNTGTWPNSSQFANWPVVMVKGDVTNADNIADGEGILIVTGDADLSNLIWHGIVLVGGEVALSGSKANVWGTLFAGLNVQLGQTVDESTIGNGNMLVQYNSCDVSKALLKFGGWRRIQNSWADNWPSYPVP